MSQFPYCQHDLFPYDDKSIFQVSFGLDLGLGLCSLFGFGILACSFILDIKIITVKYLISPSEARLKFSASGKISCGAVPRST